MNSREKIRVNEVELHPAIEELSGMKKGELQGLVARRLQEVDSAKQQAAAHVKDLADQKKDPEYYDYEPMELACILYGWAAAYADGCPVVDLASDDVPAAIEMAHGDFATHDMYCQCIINAVNSLVVQKVQPTAFRWLADRLSERAAMSIDGASLILIDIGKALMAQENSDRGAVR